MKMNFRILSLSLSSISLLGLSSIVLAQTNETQQSPLDLPPYAVGLAAGYEGGDLNGVGFDGLAVHARAIKISWSTYPLLFAGVDMKYTFGEFDTLTGTEAEGLAFGPVLGGMIPLDFLIDTPAGAPRGLGAPIYIRYNVVDDLWLDDPNDTKISGDSLSFGGQIPIPIDVGNDNVLLNIHGEYTSFLYDDNEFAPVQFGGAELDRSSWNVMFQIGFALGGVMPR